MENLKIKILSKIKKCCNFGKKTNNRPLIELIKEYDDITSDNNSDEILSINSKPEIPYSKTYWFGSKFQVHLIVV